MRRWDRWDQSRCWWWCLWSLLWWGYLFPSGTAVLIGPIAIDAAQTLHVSPYAFAMTVSIACCAAYVTPVSSPVNMLVMEPGGYAFGDYVKIGLPLLLLTLLVTVALVAVIYPV